LVEQSPTLQRQIERSTDGPSELGGNAVEHQHDKMAAEVIDVTLIAIGMAVTAVVFSLPRSGGTPSSCDRSAATGQHGTARDRRRRRQQQLRIRYRDDAGGGAVEEVNRVSTASNAQEAPAVEDDGDDRRVSRFRAFIRRWPSAAGT
jgi:hypothetical protein